MKIMLLEFGPQLLFSGIVPFRSGSAMSQTSKRNQRERRGRIEPTTPRKGAVLALGCAIVNKSEVASSLAPPFLIEARLFENRASAFKARPGCPLRHPVGLWPS